MIIIGYYNKNCIKEGISNSIIYQLLKKCAKHKSSKLV